MTLELTKDKESTDRPAVKDAACGRTGAGRYHEIAQSKGLEFVGDHPDNINELTGFRCLQGHSIRMSLKNLRDRKWTGCPDCKARSQQST